MLRAKSKICDLEATFRDDENILAFKVTVDAFAGMKVGKHTGDVGCKGKSETPGQRLGFVMDVLAKVA